MLIVHSATPSGLIRRDVSTRGRFRVGSSPGSELYFAGSGVPQELAQIDERTSVVLENRGREAWANGKPLLGRYAPGEECALRIGDTSVGLDFRHRRAEIVSPGGERKTEYLREPPYTIGSAADDTIRVDSADVDPHHLLVTEAREPAIHALAHAANVELAVLPRGRAPWSEPEKYTVLAAVQAGDIPNTPGTRAAIEAARGALNESPAFWRYTAVGELEIWQFVSERGMELHHPKSAPVWWMNGRAEQGGSDATHASRLLSVLRPVIGDRPGFWEALGVLPWPRPAVIRPANARPEHKEHVADPRMDGSSFVFYVMGPDLERWTVTPDYRVQTEVIARVKRWMA